MNGWAVQNRCQEFKLSSLLSLQDLKYKQSGAFYLMDVKLSLNVSTGVKITEQGCKYSMYSNRNSDWMSPNVLVFSFMKYEFFGAKLYNKVLLSNILSMEIIDDGPLNY